MKLMVVSPSTKKYADDYEHNKIIVVTTPPTNETLKEKDKYEDVTAIGGGSVIDTAKILCKCAIIAIPTTYSGACGTNHAVYWDNDNKCNIKCEYPIVRLEEKYLEGLPKEIEAISKIDCLCHIIESLVSPKATEESDKLALESIEAIRQNHWLYASVLAGNAISYSGTNLIHGMSYPLTAKYKIPHGVALAHILTLAEKYDKVKELL